ncbi:MAG: hypothetical protein COA69_09330 [Robiginitomaculum sp.]|nr:MAG: hypothetical protein COA69_09330 [Robiginitomaculum sp.]
MTEAQIIQTRSALVDLLRDRSEDSKRPKDIEFLLLLGEEIEALKSEYLSHLLDVTAQMRRNGWTPEELVDVGFLLREHTAMIKDWKVEVSQRHDLAGKINAVRLIKLAVADPMKAEDTIRGTLATGVQFSTIQPRIPKKGTPEYTQAMAHFGVTEEMVEKGVVKIDWKGIGKYATRIAESGGRLPSSLSDTFPVCGMTYRRRRDTTKGNRND